MFSKIPDELQEKVAENSYSINEDLVLFAGVDKDWKFDNIAQSASLQPYIAHLYSLGYDDRVVRFLVKAGSQIVPTDTARSNKIDGDRHFENQGEVIIVRDKNKINKIDNNTYLITKGE